MELLLTRGQTAELTLKPAQKSELEQVKAGCLHAPFRFPQDNLVKERWWRALETCADFGSLRVGVEVLPISDVWKDCLRERLTNGRRREVAMNKRVNEPQTKDRIMNRANNPYDRKQKVPANEPFCGDFYTLSPYRWTRPLPSPSASFFTSETLMSEKSFSIVCLRQEAATANSIASCVDMPLMSA